MLSYYTITAAQTWGVFVEAQTPDVVFFLHYIV